jgi:hypothetical protein
MRRFRIFKSMQVWDPGSWKVLIDELTNTALRQYVEVRWVASLDLLDRRHRRDVALFFIFRCLSILSGVAITALSGIGLSGSSASPEIRWLIFSLGFIVAGSASMEQLGHYGQHRLLARKARQSLLNAGAYLFFGGQDGTPGDFDTFRNWVEAAIDQYNGAYDRTISEGVEQGQNSKADEARAHQPTAS